MVSKFYEVQSNNNSYYVIVSIDDDDVTHISFGGKINGCILITIKNNIGILERVSYDERCNISGTMLRSYGTITMVKTALVFTFNTYTDLKQIQFQDHSFINCKGTDLLLPPLYITLYGETWYEQKYNARLLNIKGYTNINKYLEHIKNKPKWNVLWSFIHRTISNEDINTKISIKSIWKDTTSFKDMITYMKSHNKCELFMKWLNIYFIYYTKINILDEIYYINRDNKLLHTDIIIHKTEITNPYIKSLNTRQTKQKELSSDVFSNFIPRNSQKYGGTMYTFGKNVSFTNLVNDNII